MNKIDLVLKKYNEARKLYKFNFQAYKVGLCTFDEWIKADQSVSAGLESYWKELDNLETETDEVAEEHAWLMNHFN